MSPTIALPPRTGEATQGPTAADESAAIDHAAPPPDEPAAPAHPLPAAAARTAAAGALLALLAAAFAGVGVLLLLAVRMFAVGAQHLDVGGPSLVLVTVGFAVGNAAALLLVTRGWAPLRPTTVLLTLIAAVAWPLSGHALLAAPVALLLVGALVHRDRRTPGGLRLTSLTGALTLTALALLATLAGAITAPARMLPTDTPSPPRDERAAADDTREDAAGPRKDDTRRAHAGPRKDATRHAHAGPREDAARGADASTARPRDASPPVATRADDVPAARADAPARPSARAFVRGYYRDLDRQRFARAWAKLSPGVQAALGPYARWKAGYAATLSSTPRALAVEDHGSRTSVTHILVARDKGCDGPRRFQVTWELRADGARWTVTSLGATVAESQEC